jgi:hypothetical protein
MYVLNENLSFFCAIKCVVSSAAAVISDRLFIINDDK